MKKVITIMLFMASFCLGSTAWAGENGVSLIGGCFGSPTDYAENFQDYFPLTDDPDSCVASCKTWVASCKAGSVAVGECEKIHVNGIKAIDVKVCKEDLTGADKTMCIAEAKGVATEFNAEVSDNVLDAKDSCDMAEAPCVLVCEDGDSSSVDP